MRLLDNLQNVGPDRAALWSKTGCVQITFLQAQTSLLQFMIFTLKLLSFFFFFFASLEIPLGLMKNPTSLYMVLFCGFFNPHSRAVLKIRCITCLF